MPAIGREPAPMTADYAARIARGTVWVDMAGELRGFVVFHPDGSDMLLETVATHPDHVGRGIGLALIAFCEAEARRRGSRAVRLYTNAAMARNLTLYPRLGYALDGRREEDGFARVFFRKDLAQTP
nr:GNAT family N-acetyltransferase [Jannaschia formosa]